jgi:hypothetical protein
VRSRLSVEPPISLHMLAPSTHAVRVASGSHVGKISMRAALT